MQCCQVDILGTGDMSVEKEERIQGDREGYDMKMVIGGE